MNISNQWMSPNINCSARLLSKHVAINMNWMPLFVNNGIPDQNIIPQDKIQSDDSLSYKYQASHIQTAHCVI